MIETHFLAVDSPVDLEATLMGGQAFRWVIFRAAWYSGVIQDCLVNLRAAKGGIEYRSQYERARMGPLLESYFRLDDDIQAIRAELSRDPIIGKLIHKYPGLRLLRQDPWECLVAYCCSAPNSVKGITRLVEKLALDFGEPLECDGQKLNTFPNPARIASTTEMGLREKGFGLHAPRIFRVSNAVSNGSLDLDWLRVAPYQSVKKL